MTKVLSHQSTSDAVLGPFSLSALQSQRLSDGWNSNGNLNRIKPLFLPHADVIRKDWRGLLYSDLSMLNQDMLLSMFKGLYG